jgi:hypothetical protein
MMELGIEGIWTDDIPVKDNAKIALKASADLSIEGNPRRVLTAMSQAWKCR